MADPIDRRTADGLRGEIESGRLESGHRLPAENPLGDQFAASRNTVRDAVTTLVTLGLAGIRPGPARIYGATPPAGLQPVSGPASLSRIILVIPTFTRLYQSGRGIT